MNYKFKLERTDYVEGSFKRESDLIEVGGEMKTSLDGEFNVGTLDDRETGNPIQMVIKIRLHAVTSNKSSEQKIAEITTNHILFFSLEDENILLGLRDNVEPSEEYRNMIKCMINTGYMSIKENIETIFSKAKISIELPYTLME